MKTHVSYPIISYTNDQMKLTSLSGRRFSRPSRARGRGSAALEGLGSGRAREGTGADGLVMFAQQYREYGGEDSSPLTHIDRQTDRRSIGNMVGRFINNHTHRQINRQADATCDRTRGYVMYAQQDREYGGEESSTLTHIDRQTDATCDSTPFFGGDDRQTQHATARLVFWGRSTLKPECLVSSQKVLSMCAVTDCTAPEIVNQGRQNGGGGAV